jgi:16S rRNA (cytidine1402-2'-O)-methyltransferase
MSGTLYVVATPIGNLEDVTLRALRVLREVALVAAEDTRRTSKLLQHYSISTPTTSLHEHNERTKSAQLIERLRTGESIALVSDAGTPLVSDPGASLVAAAHAAGIRVEPVPGPSALVAALSASGFDGDLVHFAGFPPAKGAVRRRWFDGLAGLTGVLVLYEAPHRIRDTLADLLETFGDIPAAVGRELTKAHEELAIRPISAHLQGNLQDKGEYTVVVRIGERAAATAPVPNDEELQHEFGLLTNIAGSTKRENVRQLARKYGLRTRDLYEKLATGKYSGE